MHNTNDTDELTLNELLELESAALRTDVADDGEETAPLVH